jgi:hypothetical protein
VARRISNWLIAIGGSFIAAALFFVPAAFGPHADRSLLAAAATVASLGMVLAASGLYIKARFWTEVREQKNRKRSRRQKRKIQCDLCRQNDAVILCRGHRLQLCAECLPRHYDFRSCLYAPSTRIMSSKPRPSALDRPV